MKLRTRLILFGVAVLAQMALLAAVPAPKAYTLLTGRTLLLKTAPVDPYDILSGYYVTLNYQVSRPPKSPLDWDRLETDTEVCVVLREGEGGLWEAQSVHARRSDVPPGRVFLMGRTTYRGVRYGIETYYIPERARDAIESDLSRNRDRVRVEVKVDSFGHAALCRLLIGDRVYDY